MSLDPNTFGTAPAALYLTELLNQRSDQALTRKVTRLLAASRETLNELGEAHLEYDTLSTRTFGRLLTLLSEHNQRDATHAIAAHDPPGCTEKAGSAFIAGIVVNVLEGGIKTWKRRVQEARRKQSTIARNTPTGCTVEDAMANPLEDEKGPKLLQERSKRYLERKGKKDTLY
jgi:hypothetical protein